MIHKLLQRIIDALVTNRVHLIETEHRLTKQLDEVLETMGLLADTIATQNKSIQGLSDSVDKLVAQGVGGGGGPDPDVAPAVLALTDSTAVLDATKAKVDSLITPPPAL